MTKPTSQKRVQWEYRHVNFDYRGGVPSIWLNREGEQGWILTVKENNDWYFMRPIQKVRGK